MQTLVALSKSTEKDGVPYVTHKFVHLRAGHINGCSICVYMHVRDLKNAGEPDERVFAVAAWHDTAYCGAAERADPVPDDI